MSEKGREDTPPTRHSPDNPDKGRRGFLKYAAAAAVGVGLASAIEIPVLTNLTANEDVKLKKANSEISQLNSQVQSDATKINDLEILQAGSNGIVDLSINEQVELEAIVETIIPSDSNGPGAKEAGVIYFIARQLDTDYGSNARMYMQPPFVQSGQSGPITVDGLTYSAGSQTVPWQAGMKYQYNMTLREFWKYGLDALETYANRILGKNFEDLSSDDKVQVLGDLYDNKPPSFNGILPQDFFQELIFMTWSGFLMDPMYGGNMGMVGWNLTGFTGANMGDAFNEGRNVTQLMVADKPTSYSPHSTGEYQKTLNILSGVGGT